MVQLLVTDLPGRHLSDYALQLTDELLQHAYQQFCGIEIIEQIPGYCKTRLKVTDNVDNLSHTLHGGVIYSMLDVTSMFATIAVLQDGEYAITNSFSCNVLSATNRGAWVEFEASIIRNGRNMLFSDCKAFKIGSDGEKKLIATAQLSKFKRQQDLNAV